MPKIRLDSRHLPRIHSRNSFQGRAGFALFLKRSSTIDERHMRQRYGAGFRRWLTEVGTGSLRFGAAPSFKQDSRHRRSANRLLDGRSTAVDQGARKPFCIIGRWVASVIVDEGDQVGKPERVAGEIGVVGPSSTFLPPAAFGRREHCGIARQGRRCRRSCLGWSRRPSAAGAARHFEVEGVPTGNHCANHPFHGQYSCTL